MHLMERTKKFERHNICHNLPITCHQNNHNMSHNILSWAKMNQKLATHHLEYMISEKTIKEISTYYLWLILNVIKGIEMTKSVKSLYRDKFSPSIIISVLRTYKIQTKSSLLLLPPFVFLQFLLFCHWIPSRAIYFTNHL